ncbi:MAG: DNA polymerase IV [Desulfobacteraceae bacterium]
MDRTVITRVILHIDMDAFYASVEQMDNPALKGRPVIVGGTSNRGVVSAASYEAREFGVRSAMPIFKAKQRCPDGVYLPVRMNRYQEVSRQVMEILKRFSPLVEQVSIDEAYMDISGVDKLLGLPRDIGLELKRRIKETTSLTCSIGIAPNKFLAKVASDLDKPDGLTIIPPEKVPQFIQRLPIGKVPGVGKKAVQTLHKMRVVTLGDVRQLRERALFEKTGKFGERLFRLSRGIDETPVVPHMASKSISSEKTLSVNTNDQEILKKKLMTQSEMVGKRAREKGVKGMTVTLKLKRADFTQMTRRVTLEEVTNSTNTIYEQGLKLLAQVKASTKFRLIGIGLSNLVTVAEIPKQLDLFRKTEPHEKSWEDVERAMDTIKERFGGDAIRRGGVLKDPQSE